jgi:hypothetical protein
MLLERFDGAALLHRNYYVPTSRAIFSTKSLFMNDLVMVEAAGVELFLASTVNI